MQILYHDDNAQVEVASSVDQYKGFFSAEVGGVKVPLEYDSIDFISCGQVASTPSILMISGDVYKYPEGHLVRAKEKIEGEDASSIEIGIHEDDNQVELKSSVDQYKGFFSAEVGGVKRPIEYDNINFINCDEVNSSASIIDVSDEAGYRKPAGHYVEAKKILGGEDGDAMGVLMHDDKNLVRVHSSIDQFKNFLADYHNGVYLPIEFDQIDFINCGQVVSHPIIVDNGDNIGYYFSDGFQEHVFDEYPMFDSEEVVMRDLPEWAGEGQYEAYENKDAIANFDNASLGTRNHVPIQIGQDYYLADEILPAEDFE